ncbi:hypothetical protein BDF19DRAFT_324496 [Syncephalis fuscata]|nr:hypothetical protein BDF19DRAFT_324496 [Syncephalis fuscata]
MLADKTWMENTTSLLGIPLHPLGEICIYDFASGQQENYELSRAEVQARVTGLHRQIVSYLIVSFMFVPNITKAIKVLMCQPKNLSGWCCFITSLMGASIGVVTALTMLLNHINCRHACWCLILSICIAMMFNSIILLHKAYLALLQQYWVLFIGSFCTLLQLLFMLAALRFIPITIEAYGGCIANYSPILVYTWIAAALPVNAFFSFIFCYVAYNQYKSYGSSSWKKLTEEGIQAICLVTLCNIVCGIFIAFELFGKFSEMFFVIDWLFTSTVLANDCESRYKTAKKLKEASDRCKECNNTQMDIKETITTYHDRFRGTTNFTSFY